MTETAHRQLLAGVREHAVACNAEGRESVLADVVARIDGLGEQTPVEARSLPVVDEWLETAMAATVSSTQPLVELLRRHRGSLHWAIPYGDVADNPDIDHMRTRYAYGLLAGSASRGAATVPWATDDLLLGFVIQGPGVMYPPHHHLAVETYAILGGTARWKRGTEDWTTRPPGTVIHHEANMSHATHTTDEPTLSWVAWTTDADCEAFID